MAGRRKTYYGKSTVEFGGMEYERASLDTRTRAEFLADFAKWCVYAPPPVPMPDHIIVSPHAMEMLRGLSWWTEDCFGG